MYRVLINTTNEREGSLPHHRAMNETNLKTINCMIKNFPTNKMEKIQDFNSRTIFFFNSVSFAFNAVWKISGFHKGFNRLFDTDCETIMRGP